MDEATELKLIGQRIREARIACEMSQADLAYAAGISVPHISDIELGKARMNVLSKRSLGQLPFAPGILNAFAKQYVIKCHYCIPPQ